MPSSMLPSIPNGSGDTWWLRTLRNANQLNAKDCLRALEHVGQQQRVHLARGSPLDSFALPRRRRGGQITTIFMPCLI